MISEKFYLGIDCSIVPTVTQDVSDSVVVITGAGSGLGRKMAYYFAVRRKARVALIDVNEVR